MKYILRKLLIFVVTAWVTLTINFILPRLMPGNPAEAMIAKFKSAMNPQAIHALEIAFGLNTHESTFTQYIHYLGQVLSGNFGVSLSYYPNTVAEEIAVHMPWTIGLVGVITILSFIAGTMLGVRSGWRRDSGVSSVSVPASTKKASSTARA
jgi:peptide/nickel transport system permease protein